VCTLLKSVYKRNEDVVQREVAGEMFLVPIRGHLADLQELFVMNETGQWLWRGLDGVRTIEELAAGLVDAFEVESEQAQVEVGVFIAELAEVGLVEECSVAGEP
jgi:hypothetical protein